MTSLISIIIPVYNGASFVTMALDSALRQTYSHLEIILINDASTDNTAEVLEAFLKDHPRREVVKIISNRHNIGPGGCRNVGMDLSVGEYLFFLDSDDEIPVTCIESLVFPMSLYSVDYVIGSVETVDLSQGKTQIHIQPSFVAHNASDIDYDALFESYFKMVVWNKLYRKSFFTSNGLRFEPDIYHEDQLFLFYVAFQTKSYAVVPGITYRYYRREDSITGRYTEKNYNDLIFVLQRMIAFLDRLSDSPAKLRSAQIYIFLLQFQLSMTVLDTVQFPYEVQKEYIKRFGRVRIPLKVFFTIQNGYWREWVFRPLFYLSRPLFLWAFRIFQFIKRWLPT